MSEPETIAVVDDDESVRRAFRRILVTAGFKVLAFASAAELFDCPDSLRASCLISDLRMPEIDGLQLQEELIRRMPHAGLIFVSGHADVQASVRAMKSGAVDFLEKPVGRVELLEAIDRATRRAHRAESDAGKIRLLRQNYEQMTPRERQVFALVTAGLLNKQIAAELGAAEKTIKQHRGVVMRKMHADSLADLVVMAERLGVRPSNVNFPRARGLRES